MSRRLFHTLAALILLLAVVFTALAVGSATALPLPPKPGPVQDQAVWSGLYIRSHRVTVEIDNQVAVTKIEQVFVNEGSGLAEGQYLFPLPEGAAVSDLTLFIDGVPIKGQILDAKQAQQIYTEIVRRSRDPVLLKYVGRSAIQANIFPIPPRQERKIEITYSSIVTADSGLLSYTYPLRTDYASSLPVRETSVSVTARSRDPISTVYSPNPFVIISRPDDYTFRAGFEASNFRATDDFAVYYGIASKEINASLLTYRASAVEDGFFMLMLTPPLSVGADRVIPRDVVFVLDQSGSMAGEKWEQARAAVRYVLKNLNPQDRFNVVAFSTGYRVYARTLQPAGEAEGAINWINGLEAIGGTDINGALTTALQATDRERQTIILFLTDGLPTEGVTDTRKIIENFQALATPNVRLFAFGVGNDVDTFLLDSLSSGYGGTSVYVRPNENIEQRVSSLYNKIVSPVLTAIRLDADGPILEDMYPSAPLPDLFAGSQLIVTGRFRGEGTATITLTGQLNGQTQRYTYSDLKFPANAGGQPFIPRLWATRKIGALLNQIRLGGEKPELVDSIIRLSVRYGIITPYTSYLIQEDDIRLRRDGPGIIPPPGQPGATIVPLMSRATPPAANYAGGPPSGAAAVDKAREAGALQGAEAPAMLPTATSGGRAGGQQGQEGQSGGGARTEPPELIKQVGDRTFVLRDGIWLDTLYTPETMKPVPVIFLSEAYFKLLDEHPEIKEYLALGERVIVVVGDTAYEIKPG